MLRENNTIAGKRLGDLTLPSTTAHDFVHVAIHPDGTRLAICRSAENEITERDIETGKILRTLPGHAFSGNLQYSPDGTRLASTGSYDFVIRLFPVRAR